MNAIAEQVSETVEPTAPAREVMIDGENISFGQTRNIKTDINLDEGTIIFLIYSGHKVVFNVFAANLFAEVKNYPELHKNIIFAGIANKVKSNAASCKLFDVKEIPVLDENGNPRVDHEGTKVVELVGYPALYEAILANVKAIEEGKFNLRGTGIADEDEELTMDERCFALTTIDFPENFVKAENPEKILTFGSIPWTKETIDDPKVIADIKAVWGEFSRTARNAIRKDFGFMAIKSQELRKSGKEKTTAL